jgi:hypothetical protein
MNKFFDLLNALGLCRKNQVNHQRNLPRARPVENVDAPARFDDYSEDAALFSLPNTEHCLPMKSPESVAFWISENEQLVNEFFFVSVQRAILQNLPELILFRLGESRLLAKLERHNYEALLDKLENYFMRSEQYERIPICKHLRDKHYVNRVIDESAK